MFNDQLEKRECEDLIKRLAECVFPFQCAHGRPTVVPLVRIPAVADSNNREDFGEAWARWRMSGTENQGSDDESSR